MGCVGTAFSDLARRVLRRTLDELAIVHPAITGPMPSGVARAARWVEPVLVADAEQMTVFGVSVQTAEAARLWRRHPGGVSPGCMRWRDCRRSRRRTGRCAGPRPAHARCSGP
ncbi:hypothetical protein ACFXG4_31220 [Nocardia sp. NPDC059246]|uniref:hypothetical protein n=1 Tax=unclassified Nocardia TaxID=2637762 RepID=UPI0036B7F368